MVDLTCDNYHEQIHVKLVGDSVNNTEGLVMNVLQILGQCLSQFREHNSDSLRSGCVLPACLYTLLGFVHELLHVAEPPPGMLCLFATQHHRELLIWCTPSCHVPLFSA